MKPKYESLNRLRNAFENGELVDYRLVIDDYSAYLIFYGDIPTDIRSIPEMTKWMREKNREARDMFYDPDLADFLLQCKTWGIPAENFLRGAGILAIKKED